MNEDELQPVEYHEARDFFLWLKKVRQAAIDPQPLVIIETE